MIDGIEDPDDAALDFQCVRDRDLSFEQVANGLGDHGLAVSGWAVDEHRMAGVDGRTELVEDPIGQHQVRKRLPHAISHRAAVGRGGEGFHVSLVLGERHRRHANVVAVFEKEGRAGAARVGDPIPVRSRTEHGAARDLTLPVRPEAVEDRLDHRKGETEPTRQFRPGEFAGKEQRLQHQLHHEVLAQPCFRQGAGRGRMRNPGASLSDCDGHSNSP